MDVFMGVFLAAILCGLIFFAIKDKYGK